MSEARLVCLTANTLTGRGWLNWQAPTAATLPWACTCVSIGQDEEPDGLLYAVASAKKRNVIGIVVYIVD